MHFHVFPVIDECLVCRCSGTMTCTRGVMSSWTQCLRPQCGPSCPGCRSRASTAPPLYSSSYTLGPKTTGVHCIFVKIKKNYLLARGGVNFDNSNLTESQSKVFLRMNLNLVLFHVNQSTHWHLSLTRIFSEENNFIYYYYFHNCFCFRVTFCFVYINQIELLKWTVFSSYSFSIKKYWSVKGKQKNAPF